MKIKPWAVSALMVLGLAQFLVVQTPGQLAQRGTQTPQRGGGGAGAARGTSSVIPGVAGPGVPSFVLSPTVFSPDAANNVAPLVADLIQNCSADLRWINAPVPGANPKVVSRGNDVTGLNLLSVVGKPDNCLPAEIRLNVYYYDVNENLVCSGIMQSAVIQTQPTSQDSNSILNNTMTANIEIKPYSLPEFFRWRNGPRPQALSTRRLICVDPDGLTEVGPEFEFATSVRVYASLIPRGGSISTTEIRLSLGF